MKTTTAGFTLVEIMTVVGIVGLLAVIALPSFLKTRTMSQTKACLNNLRIMDSAKEQAAMANMWGSGRTVQSGTAQETIVLEYLKGGKLAACPAGGTYSWNPIGTNPSCSKSADGHTMPQ